MELNEQEKDSLKKQDIYIHITHNKKKSVYMFSS